MSTLDGMSELGESRPTHQPTATPLIPRLSRRQTLLDMSSIFAWVLASDLLLYHSGGYAAWGLFLPIAAAVMLLTRRSLGATGHTLAVCALMVACSVRLAWCGSIPAVLARWL